MPDEIEREVTTRKVTSNTNNPVNGYNSSEQRTTRVTNDQNANGLTGGLIFAVVLLLAIGGGALAYFLNNRTVEPPVALPKATETIRDNKSTIIERNNTTIKEVAPATPQSTPKVDVNVPVTITQPPSAPAPRVTVTATPRAIAPTTPTTPSATPTATSNPAN